MVSEDKEEPVLDDKLLLVDDEKGILTMLENLCIRRAILTLQRHRPGTKL